MRTSEEAHIVSGGSKLATHGIQHGIGHQTEEASIQRKLGGVAEQRKLTLEDTGMRTGTRYGDCFDLFLLAYSGRYRYANWYRV